MKKIKSNIALLFFFALATVSFVACEDEGYDEYGQGGVQLESMSGEWYITISDEATGDVLVEHAYHETYDTNEGNNTMIIDDHQTGWYLKGLINVNPADHSFTVTDEENQNDPGTTFSISEGKILKRAAHSPTGAVVDSIYFKGTFSYDPESTLIFSGYKRTGFIEEE
ncbi:MAG: hypothetical protein DI539_04310 [Flavobacterium psychrophilum]|nr:MAG: hypothetical protein DI539_04310 [Flavobacterium psychrophilum]